MARMFAGAAACFLFMTGAFLLWQSRAEQAPLLPPAPPAARAETPSMVVPAVVQAPEATPQSREQKRFSRADKDKNGRIERAELLEPRRKAFAKLDTNGNGTLSFEEWAVKTLDKFNGADKDRSGWLTPAEYATTAPPPAEEEAVQLLKRDTDWVRPERSRKALLQRPCRAPFDCAPAELRSGRTKI